MECDNTSVSETSCLTNADSFADLVKKEVIRKLHHFEQEKKEQLVLKRCMPTFFEEIRSMMYTHGDVWKPLRESVVYMGTVLRDQMNMLLAKATEALPTSKRNLLTHGHILSLLFQNKRKLKRLLYYLKMRDMKECLFKNNKPTADLIDDVEHGQGKRVKPCLEFLLELDENFDTASIMDHSDMDPTILKRQQRRYVNTYHMDETEYLQFTKKFQASFFPKGRGAYFKQWLLIDKVTPLVPTELALQIINILAYETVAEIMDLCLYLKYNRNIDQPDKEKIAATNDKAVDSSDGASTSLAAANTSLPQRQATNILQQEFSDDNGGSASSTPKSTKRRKPLKKRFKGPLKDPIMPNYNNHTISSNIDIDVMSEMFGNEFKKETVKTQITPANIREAVNLASGIYEYEYNVHWKEAKRPKLLCIQDNDTISLPKYN